MRFVDGVTCDSGPYFLLADVIHLPCSGCLAAFRCPVRSTEKITVAYLRWLVFTDFLAARTMGSVAWLCCMLRQTHQDGARADYSTEASSPTVIDLSPSGHRCLDVSRCLPRGQRPPRPGSAQRLPAVPRPLTASSYRVECDLPATAGRPASCCLHFAPGWGVTPTRGETEPSYPNLTHHATRVSSGCSRTTTGAPQRVIRLGLRHSKPWLEVSGCVGCSLLAIGGERSGAKEGRRNSNADAMVSHSLSWTNEFSRSHVLL